MRILELESLNMAKIIQLKKTPIKEIILTISFTENADLNSLEKFLNLTEIQKTFTLRQTGFHTKVEAKNTNEKPIANIQNDGYVLRSTEPLNRIIQARRGSFSLHKVKGYESFDVLYSELIEYWNALLKCTGDLTINDISVRYLNFIEKENTEEIQDLVKIHTIHPFGNDIDNNFSQLKFEYQKNSEIIVNLVTARGMDNYKEGIIFDIILNRRIKPDEKNALSLFKEMRDVKNDLFFETITEQTINKYNQ